MVRIATRVAVLAVVAMAGRAPVALAQQPSEPVDFRPFADNRHWIVKQPLVYTVGVSRDSVVVPRGFVTDLASIPPALQSLINQNGPWMLPAIVHDYLYWEQGCTREQSDRLLLVGMVEHEVDRPRRTAIYQAVRRAGGRAWAANAKERRQGRPRIIPEDRLDDRRRLGATVKWPDYQRRLWDEGVRAGPRVPIANGFCARGSMRVEDALTRP